MSNRCDNSGVALCIKVWGKGKPFFNLTGECKNGMVIYGSHVCTIYSRYINIYPETLRLNDAIYSSGFASIESNVNWHLEKSKSKKSDKQ